MQKLGDVPGGKKALEALNGLRDRIDDLQKRMNRVDELEKRVAALEKKAAGDEVDPEQAVDDLALLGLELHHDEGLARHPHPERAGDDLEPRRRRSGLLAVEHDGERRSASR